MCHCCTCARPAHLNTPALQPTDHSLSAVRAISESRLYLQTPNAVGAVLRCTHPNAICIPNRTGSSAETLDMANPENLEILKILVQTDAVRFGVPFCTSTYHANLNTVLTLRKGPYITVSTLNYLMLH